MRKKTSKRTLYKDFELPKWWGSIKQGSHGSNKDQKKLWTIMSEHVRKEEAKKYGYCVACKKPIHDWKMGQAGHFRAWSICNGMFKYERKNLALICTHCNHISDGPINEAFAKEMNRRYGKCHTQWITDENLKHSGETMELPLLVEMGKKYYEEA